MKSRIIALSLMCLASVAAQPQDADTPPAGGNARAACKADYQKFCKGVKMGGARDCLNQHKDELSSACRDVLQKHDAEQGANSGAQTSPPSTDKPQQ